MAELNLAGGAENLWGATVTIKSGASESEPVCTQGRALSTVFMSAAWTAADIVVKAGLTIDNLVSGQANQKTGNAAANVYTAFPTGDAVFAPYISIQSVDNTGAAVPQAADRVLTLIFRRFVS